MSCELTRCHVCLKSENSLKFFTVVTAALAVIETVLLMLSCCDVVQIFRRMQSRRTVMMKVDIILTREYPVCHLRCAVKKDP